MSHTIAAISTGNVVSAIGIIRLTGDDCVQIAGKVFTLNNKTPLTEAPQRKLVLGQLHDRQGRIIDSCAIVSRGPKAGPFLSGQGVQHAESAGRRDRQMQVGNGRRTEGPFVPGYGGSLPQIIKEVGA